MRETLVTAKGGRVNSVEPSGHDRAEDIYVIDEVSSFPSSGSESGTELSLRIAALSDVGRTRKHNEDAWLVQTPVFVVADGMGGHDAGDLASRAVVKSFSELAN